jgi:ubiquitin C-terminal hydrolase
LEKFKLENDTINVELLSYACLFCMRLFSGYEDLYKPLNDLIEVKLNDEQLKEFGLKFLIDYQPQFEQNLPLNNSNEISKLPPKQDHVSGLVNFGNTCYLNCIGQALYSCKK